MKTRRAGDQGGRTQGEERQGQGTGKKQSRRREKKSKGKERKRKREGPSLGKKSIFQYIFFIYNNTKNSQPHN